MCSCSGNCNCNSTIIPRGPAGPQGPQGDPGVNGTNGVTPTISIGTVDTVPFGDPATVTNTGTPPNAIFNFEIPEGDTGPQGPPGPASIERIFNDQGQTSVTTSASVVLTFTQLTQNGEAITLDFQSSPGDYADTINSSSVQVNSTTLFFASKDPSNQGLLEAKIKYDRDPNLNPSGYPNIEQPNIVKGSLKIERISSTILRISGNIHAYCFQSSKFGLSVYTQKSWILNENRSVSSASNFSMTFGTTADFEPAVSVTQILKYNIPNI